MDTSARIVALRRYISLLRQEEGRLNWVKSSSKTSVQGRDDAEAAARENSRKLSSADKELRDLEGKESARR